MFLCNDFNGLQQQNWKHLERLAISIHFPCQADSGMWSPMHRNRGTEHLVERCTVQYTTVSFTLYHIQCFKALSC